VLRHHLSERRKAERGSEVRTAVCEHCGAVFPTPRAHARYCSGRCRTRSFRAKRVDTSNIEEKGL
jgi:hypothetical protein